MGNDVKGEQWPQALAGFFYRADEYVHTSP